MKTIYRSKDYLGGFEYRATGNNETVNLQERKAQQVKWKTIETISKADFDRYADEENIYNPYNQNPAHINNIIKGIHEYSTSKKGEKL